LPGHREAGSVGAISKAAQRRLSGAQAKMPLLCADVDT